MKEELNKPKYHFFSNTIYALKGLKAIIKTEKSFRIELVFAAVLLPVILLLDVSFIEKILLFTALMSVLITEIINSAIERIVDFISPGYHKLTGEIKDVASAAVFFSIVSAVVVWVCVLWRNFL